MEGEGATHPSRRRQRAVDIEEADCVLDRTQRDWWDDAADLCHYE